MDEYFGLVMVACPDCGGRPLGCDNRFGWYVMCPSCHLEGEVKNTATLAVEQWNNLRCGNR